MIVEIAPKETAGLRYGLTVSKKVSKKAVVRNHIKRRLKSVACDVLPAYTDQNLDIVLIGRVEAGQRSYEDLQNDLRWCLKKMGIEKNNEKTAD